MNRAILLSQVEAFLLEADMLPTRFGIEAMNDSAFVFDLRQGKDVRLSTAEKVVKFMADWRALNRPLARSAA